MEKMSYLDRYFIREVKPLKNSEIKVYQVVKIDIWQANKMAERGEKIYISRKQAYKIARKLEKEKEKANASV